MTVTLPSCFPAATARSHWACQSAAGDGFAAALGLAAVEAAALTAALGLAAALEAGAAAGELAIVLGFAAGLEGAAAGEDSGAAEGAAEPPQLAITRSKELPRVATIRD